MGFYGIPNPDPDLLFWARSKNPEIPGIGSGFENPEKNPSEKFRKTSRSEFIFYPRASEFFLISGFLSSGFGIFYLRDGDFFRGMGYPDKKPTLT